MHASLRLTAIFFTNLEPADPRMWWIEERIENPKLIAYLKMESFIYLQTRFGGAEKKT